MAEPSGCSRGLVLALAASLVGLSAPAGASGAARGPDLAVTTLSSPPRIVAAGGAFSVRDTVRNVGRRRASASTVRYFLSRHFRIGGGDVRLGGLRRVPSLGPGRSSRRRASLRVPTGVAPGTYRVIACARRAGDARRRNNCLASKRIVTVRGAGSPGPAPGPQPQPDPPPQPQPQPQPPPPAPAADGTAPVVVLDTPTQGFEAGDDTPTFGGAAGTAQGDAQRVRVEVFSGPAAAGAPLQSLDATVVDGRFSAEASSVLVAGTYTARATQADETGNTGSSAPVTFSVSPALLAAGDVDVSDPNCSPAYPAQGPAGETIVAGEATANLLDGLAGTVAAIGDLVHGSSATEANFRECYEPTWGRHKARTRPAIGNHHYTSDEPAAGGYFSYFGSMAGEPGEGYYSYNIGAWHVVVLNSRTCVVSGCPASSPQVQWLREDLAANSARCTLAYWHHPLFSSRVGPAAVKPLWDELYAADADLVLNSHAHSYERFAPMTPDGPPPLPDPRAIRQFTVGTGGAALVNFTREAAGSEVRDSTSFGILRLALQSNSYEWKFQPTPGGTLTNESGTTACH